MLVHIHFEGVDFVLAKPDLVLDRRLSLLQPGLEDWKQFPLGSCPSPCCLVHLGHNLLFEVLLFEPNEVLIFLSKQLVDAWAVSQLEERILVKSEIFSKLIYLPCHKGNVIQSEEFFFPLLKKRKGNPVNSRPTLLEEVV